MVTAGFIPLGCSEWGMQQPNYITPLLSFRVTGAVSHDFMAGTRPTSPLLYVNVDIPDCTVPNHKMVHKCKF
jgi:hypothetical protein